MIDMKLIALHVEIKVTWISENARDSWREAGWQLQFCAQRF